MPSSVPDKDAPKTSPKSCAKTGGEYAPQNTGPMWAAGTWTAGMWATGTWRGE